MEQPQDILELCAKALPLDMLRVIYRLAVTPGRRLHHELKAVVHGRKTQAIVFPTPFCGFCGARMVMVSCKLALTSWGRYHHLIHPTICSTCFEVLPYQLGKSQKHPNTPAYFDVSAWKVDIWKMHKVHHSQAEEARQKHSRMLTELKNKKET
jgi:hypothetical protein